MFKADRQGEQPLPVSSFLDPPLFQLPPRLIPLPLPLNRYAIPEVGHLLQKQRQHPEDRGLSWAPHATQCLRIQMVDEENFVFLSSTNLYTVKGCQGCTNKIHGA